MYVVKLVSGVDEDDKGGRHRGTLPTPIPPPTYSPLSSVYAMPCHVGAAATCKVVYPKQPAKPRKAKMKKSDLEQMKTRIDGYEREAQAMGDGAKFYERGKWAEESDTFKLYKSDAECQKVLDFCFEGKDKSRKAIAKVWFRVGPDYPSVAHVAGVDCNGKAGRDEKTRHGGKRPPYVRLDAVARLFLESGREFPADTSEKWKEMDAKEYKKGAAEATAESITKRLSKALSDGGKFFTVESLAAVEKAVAALVELPPAAPETTAPATGAPDVNALLAQMAQMQAALAALVESK